MNDVSWKVLLLKALVEQVKLEVERIVVATPQILMLTSNPKNQLG